MTDNDHSLLQELEDQISKYANDYYRWFKEQYFAGRKDGVLVPTQEELLLLFKYWYEVAKTQEFFLQEVWTGGYMIRRGQLAYRRLGLIEKCLPPKEVNAVLKQLRKPLRGAEKDGSWEEVAQGFPLRDPHRRTEEESSREEKIAMGLPVLEEHRRAEKNESREEEIAQDATVDDIPS